MRAAAESEIPLISAVGHETDTTLIDYAADRRAPTPSAAAEIAVPVRAELLGDLLDYEKRMVSATGRLLEERRLRVEGLGRGLPDPVRLLEDKSQRLDDRVERLVVAMAGLLERRRARLAEWSARLPHPGQQVRLARQRLEAEARQLTSVAERGLERRRQSFLRLDPTRRLSEAWTRRREQCSKELAGLGRLLESTSYRSTLARGYAVVHGPDGLITRGEAATPGLTVAVEFADGRVGATLIDPPSKTPKRRAAKAAKGDDPQGRLL